MKKETRLHSILEQLKAKTNECRTDMHEPDEQDITAVVAGYRLDNAFGPDPFNNCGEFTVGLLDGSGDRCEWFNLADLIALARMADLSKL